MPADRPDIVLSLRRQCGALLLKAFAMLYSVWETDSANILGTFSSEAEALALVRDIADSVGEVYVDSLSLTSTADDGSVEAIAAGAELLAIARRRRPAALRDEVIAPRRST